MTTSPRFEQHLSDWLQDGPVDAPGEILEAVVTALPSTPQRRAALRVPWRTAPVNGPFRALIAAAAVVAIAAGAILLVPRLLPGTVGGLPSPTAESPSASAGASPSPSVEPPSPTAEPPSPSISPTAAVAGDCAGSDLAAELLDWQGAAGTRFGTIRVRNTGATSCLVAGTPGLRLIDGHGDVFLDSADLGNPASVSPAKPVFTLRAGGADSVYLMVGLTNYCGPDPVVPVRLALVLPKGLGPVIATGPAGGAISMAPCNGPTVATVLHVQVGWSTTAP